LGCFDENYRRKGFRSQVAGSFYAVYSGMFEQIPAVTGMLMAERTIYYQLLVCRYQGGVPAFGQEKANGSGCWLVLYA
jgi:hypothetical protein